MKKFLTLVCIVCFMFQAIAQTDGLTYQAVIISPDALELPGVNSEGNYLPNKTIAIRFTIYDEDNQLEFQEVQITDTDDFGRINLLIGDGNHDYFKEMNWDGTPKDLKVEIDFDAGNNFELMSRERLTFLPYAYHRNITATGTLAVDGRTFLNDELQVEGPTNLESTLDVNNGNATNLTGSLTVDGETNLNNALNVNLGSPTNLSGNLTVSNGSATSLTGDLTVNYNSALNGTLDVIGLTTLGDLTVNGEASFGDLSAETLLVNQATVLNGQTLINGPTLIDGLGSQIRITSDFPNTGEGRENHPVIIDGGRNGLAIKVNGSRSNATNFITFYDDIRVDSWGRIEGETDDEFGNNADYLFDQSSLSYDIFDASVDLTFSIIDGVIAAGGLVAALADVRPCVGLGACIASPGPAMIAASVAEVAIQAGKITTSGIAIDRSLDARDDYDFNKDDLQGVTYASGSGDYAEYLMREDFNQKMTYGDIVAVKGGKISKSTKDGERMMVISYKPIVLGNMPQASEEKKYEKVAFMGQVPVKVFGKVTIGDYIIPSGKNDGIGISISPKRITSKNVKEIVGIAWGKSNNVAGFNLINVAVGLNTNDNNPIIENLEKQIEYQAIEVDELKSLLTQMIERISNLENGIIPNTTNPIAESNDNDYSERKYEIVDTQQGEMIYFELTREDIIAGIDLAERQMTAKGMDLKANVFWNKIITNPSFKEEFIKKLMVEFDTTMHYHREIDRNGKH